MRVALPTGVSRVVGGLLICGMTIAVAGTALAASFASDPKGDVKPCYGECSNYSVDLKSIQVSRSNGNLLIKVAQYGSFYAAQPLYWPQIELFTKGGSRGTPAPPFTSSQADYSIYVASGNGGVCHRPGKGYEMDLWKGNKQVQAISCQWPTHSSIVYKVPLGKLGNPKQVRARAWQAGTNRSFKTIARDVAPNTGAVSG